MFLFVFRKNKKIFRQHGGKRKKKMTRDRTEAGSAGVHQACHEVAGSPAILSLGVSDGAVLLSEMES